MKALILTVLMTMTACDAAICEPLDKRFGPDRERGFRSSREFDGNRSDFRNRDRANYLGKKQPEASRPVLPHQDLQAPPSIGMQR